MNNTSKSPRAFVAWIILGLLAGLSLLVALGFVLKIRLHRRKESRNKTYTEALELEQRPRGTTSMIREEMERREQEKESRWQRLVSRFGSSGTVVDDVEAQARPVIIERTPPNLTAPLPAQLRPAKKLLRPNSRPIWPGQERADVATQRVFQHVENPLGDRTRTKPNAGQNDRTPSPNKQALWPNHSQGIGKSPQLFDNAVDDRPTPLEALPPVSPERQARLSAQRARIFQHQDPPGMLTRQPTRGTSQRTVSVGTSALWKAGKQQNYP